MKIMSNHEFTEILWRDSELGIEAKPYLYLREQMGIEDKV